MFEDDYGYSHEDRNEEPLPRYLTPKDIMSLFCIGKNTLYKLLEAGELKGFRVGRQWRVSKEELLRFHSAINTE